MALTFPVPAGDFANDLMVQSAAFDLLELYAESSTRGGKPVLAEIADPRWKADIGLSPMSLNDARRVSAMIRRIGAYNKFFLFNPGAPFPRFDSDGSGLAGANVTVLAVGGRTLRLSGLPGGYKLSWGDFLSVAYSGGRRQLFEVSDFVEASGAGTTQHFEVTPAPRLGVEAGNGVDLRKPAALMKFSARNVGTDDFTERLRTGLTISAIEALGPA